MIEKVLYNPTTAETEYTREEVEFMTAVSTYVARNGRPFPTLRELYHVALSLGYRRVAAASAPPRFAREPGRPSKEGQ